jgi:hypothetical protein
MNPEYQPFGINDPTECKRLRVAAGSGDGLAGIDCRLSGMHRLHRAIGH